MELFRDRLDQRHIWLGMGARWIEGVLSTLRGVRDHLWRRRSWSQQADDAVDGDDCGRGPAGDNPICGQISASYGRRQVYAVGVAVCAISTVPAFMLIASGKIVWIVSPSSRRSGPVPDHVRAQAALLADLFQPKVRYSGISFVPQFSGIFASGLTPLILTCSTWGTGRARCSPTSSSWA